MVAPYVFVFLTLPQLTIVGAFFCNSNNCGDCVSSSFIQCRWCRRDNSCYSPVAYLTNPCKTAENIVDKSHCADELSRYDPEISYKMLLLSAAAYDPVHPQQCLNNALGSAQFQIQTIITRECDFADNDCSGYVALSHILKAIVVTFRGSKNLNQVLVQFVQVLFAPKEQFFDGEVQSYFKSGFEELWYPAMATKVISLVSEHPSYQIWVTGHSLGGAMASLASTWLAYYNIAPRKQIILYTFGMPRVGDYEYALQHDRLVNNSWRVVNGDDLVPHFPTLASITVLNGPYHHGVEAFYSEAATSVYSPHKECHGKPYNEDVTCSLSEVTRSIEKHRNYFGIHVGDFWQANCVPPTR